MWSIIVYALAVSCVILAPGFRTVRTDVAELLY
jgi:hypothetical protein